MNEFHDVVLVGLRLVVGSAQKRHVARREIPSGIVQPLVFTSSRTMPA